MSDQTATPEFHADGSASEPPRDGKHASARDSAESEVQNFSLVLGGPLYTVLFRVGLIRQSLPNITRRSIALVAINWVPLLLLSLWGGVAFGNKVRIPFLYDFSMYGRFVIGLPLLLLAELFIDPSIQQAVAHFVNSGLVKDQELPDFATLLRNVMRARDSWIAEALIFILAFFPVFVFQHEWGAGAVSSWHTTSAGMSPAGWWYALLSTPILRFIIYRWTYRYCLWGFLLWKISRLNLTLTPTHPDRAAGLGFLSTAQRHFGILFCALGCGFAGRVANTMTFEGATLSSFKFLMLGFVILSVIVGLLPLALLEPKLRKVRRAGLLDYGRFANIYTESFDRKWVHSSTPPSEPLLGTADIQSLADLGNSFSFISDMRIAPISRKLILQLATWAAVPLIPAILFGTPTKVLLEELMKMVF